MTCLHVDKYLKSHSPKGVHKDFIALMATSHGQSSLAVSFMVRSKFESIRHILISLQKLSVPTR